SLVSMLRGDVVRLWHVVGEFCVQSRDALMFCPEKSTVFATVVSEVSRAPTRPIQDVSACPTASTLAICCVPLGAVSVDFSKDVTVSGLRPMIGRRIPSF